MPFECSRCDYITQYSFALDHHHKNHIKATKLEKNCLIQDLELYQCHFCETKFYLKTNLSVHARNCSKGRMEQYVEDVEEEPFLYKCHNCCFETCSKLILTSHLQQCAEVDENRRNCDYTSFDSNLQTHFSKNHKTSIRLSGYNCEHCKYQSKVKANLTQHLIRMHANNWFKCANCEYSTNVKNYLMKHIGRMHKTNQKSKTCKLRSVESYKCHECSFKAENYYDLKIHYTGTHKGRKSDLKCNDCEYTATILCNLTRHVNNMHKSKPAQTYECEKCDYKAKTNYALKEHLVRMHDFGFEWHQCAHCEYKSKVKPDLKKHIFRMHCDKGQNQTSINH